MKAQEQEEGWENAIQQTQKTHHSTDLDVV